MFIFFLLAQNLYLNASFEKCTFWLVAVFHQGCHILNKIYRVFHIDVYTLWIVISQQRNETEIQLFLCIIQKALEKHSNTFIILHIFKQIWRWNYHSMNVSGYWSVIGKWRMLLKLNEALECWIWYTSNKGNNNKNPSRWKGARCIEKSLRKKEKFH